MRILVIAWYYPPRIGGVEIAALTWGRALQAAGHSVRVLTSTANAVQGDQIGPPVLSLNELAPDPHNFEPVAQLVSRVTAELEGFRPNLVLGHQLTYPLAPAKSHAMLDLFASRNIPVVDVAHNAHLRDPDMSRSLLCHNLRAVIAVSAFVRKRLRLLGWDGPTPIIHHGVDAALFRPSQVRRSRTRRFLGLRNSDRLVFFPSRLFDIDGSLSTAKAAPTALSAFAAARRRAPNLRLLLAQPPGPVLHTHQCTRAHCGTILSPNYETSHERMPGLFDASDVVLVPSIEGFGLVYVEAMTMGKPVVALNAGAAKEVLGTSARLTSVFPVERQAARLGAMIVDAISARRRTLLTPSATQLRARSYFSKARTSERINDVVEGLFFDETPS